MSNSPGYIQPPDLLDPESANPSPSNRDRIISTRTFTDAATVSGLVQHEGKALAREPWLAEASNDNESGAIVRDATLGGSPDLRSSALAVTDLDDDFQKTHHGSHADDGIEVVSAAETRLVEVSMSEHAPSQTSRATSDFSLIHFERERSSLDAVTRSLNLTSITAPKLTFRIPVPPAHQESDDGDQALREDARQPNYIPIQLRVLYRTPDDYLVLLDERTSKLYLVRAPLFYERMRAGAAGGTPHSEPSLKTVVLSQPEPTEEHHPEKPQYRVARQAGKDEGIPLEQRSETVDEVVSPLVIDSEEETATVTIDSGDPEPTSNEATYGTDFDNLEERDFDTMTDTTETTDATEYAPSEGLDAELLVKFEEQLPSQGGISSVFLKHIVDRLNDLCVLPAGVDQPRVTSQKDRIAGESFSLSDVSARQQNVCPLCGAGLPQHPFDIHDVRRLLAIAKLIQSEYRRLKRAFGYTNAATPASVASQARSMRERRFTRRKSKITRANKSEGATSPFSSRWTDDSIEYEEEDIGVSSGEVHSPGYSPAPLTGDHSGSPVPISQSLEEYVDKRTRMEHAEHVTTDVVQSGFHLVPLKESRSASGHRQSTITTNLYTNDSDEFHAASRSKRRSSMLPSDALTIALVQSSANSRSYSRGSEIHNGGRSKGLKEALAESRRQLFLHSALLTYPLSEGSMSDAASITMDMMHDPFFEIHPENYTDAHLTRTVASVEYFGALEAILKEHQQHLREEWKESHPESGDLPAAPHVEIYDLVTKLEPFPIVLRRRKHGDPIGQQGYGSQWNEMEPADKEGAQFQEYGQLPQSEDTTVLERVASPNPDPSGNEVYPLPLVAEIESFPWMMVDLLDQPSSAIKEDSRITLHGAIHDHVLTNGRGSAGETSVAAVGSNEILALPWHPLSTALVESGQVHEHAPTSLVCFDPSVSHGHDTERRDNVKAVPLSSSQSGLSRSAFATGYYATFFREIKMLGRGAYGSVHLARHELDGIALGIYAVKKVPVGDSRPWLLRAAREVIALSRLRHPNVVAYHHAWIEEDDRGEFAPPVPCLFVSMEYADQGALSSFIWPQLPDSDSTNATRSRLISFPVSGTPEEDDNGLRDPRDVDRLLSQWLHSCEEAQRNGMSLESRILATHEAFLGLAPGVLSLPNGLGQTIVTESLTRSRSLSASAMSSPRLQPARSVADVRDPSKPDLRRWGECGGSAGPNVYPSPTIISRLPRLEQERLRYDSRTWPLLLPETLVWRIFIDVALGLRHLHRLGVVHRDVKPENILLTSLQTERVDKRSRRTGGAVEAELEQEMGFFYRNPIAIIQEKLRASANQHDDDKRFSELVSSDGFAVDEDIATSRLLDADVSSARDALSNVAFALLESEPLLSPKEARLAGCTPEYIEAAQVAEKIVQHIGPDIDDPNEHPVKREQRRRRRMRQIAELAQTHPDLMMPMRVAMYHRAVLSDFGESQAARGLRPRGTRSRVREPASSSDLAPLESDIADHQHRGRTGTLLYLAPELLDLYMLLSPSSSGAPGATEAADSESNFASNLAALATSTLDEFAVDVWALGVTLYALAYGSFPFDSQEGDAFHQRRAIGNGVLQFPPFEAAGMDDSDETPCVRSRDLRKVISLMLQLDPSKRPTISELLALPEVRRHDIMGVLGPTPVVPKQLAQNYSVTPLARPSVQPQDEQIFSPPSALSVQTPVRTVLPGPVPDDMRVGGNAQPRSSRLFKRKASARTHARGTFRNTLLNLIPRPSKRVRSRTTRSESRRVSSPTRPGSRMKADEHKPRDESCDARTSKSDDFSLPPQLLCEAPNDSLMPQASDTEAEQLTTISDLTETRESVAVPHDLDEPSLEITPLVVSQDSRESVDAPSLLFATPNDRRSVDSITQNEDRIRSPHTTHTLSVRDLIAKLAENIFCVMMGVENRSPSQIAFIRVSPNFGVAEGAGIRIIFRLVSTLGFGLALFFPLVYYLSDTQKAPLAALILGSLVILVTLLMGLLSALSECSVEVSLFESASPSP